MKPLSILMGISITFYMTGCSTTATPIKLSSIKAEQGGNPEVNLNLCLQEIHAEKIKCLDRHFPTSPNILLLPADGKRILLAGRGESVDRRDVIIKDDDILLLNIDTSNVKMPLTANVKTDKDSEKGNNLVLAIAVENIEDKITLKDKEGNLVLEYRIMKEKSKK